MRAVWRVVGLILVLGLVAAAGVVSWDRSWHRASGANPGMACPAVVKPHHHVPLAAFGVHRVALIGDSIMAQASCAVADSLADLGIETSRHAVFGTGLLTGMDWVTTAQQILKDEKPDVVVAIFVGNYLPPLLRDASGALIKADTPAFDRAWQDRARQLSAEVHTANAAMFWVSPPPIAAPPLDRAPRLFAGYRAIRADHFLSSGRVLAGAHGREVTAKTTCGHRTTIRSADGVHLTDDGARVYGQQIAHDLTVHWGILVAPRPC